MYSVRYVEPSGLDNLVFCNGETLHFISTVFITSAEGMICSAHTCSILFPTKYEEAIKHEQNGAHKRREYLICGYLEAFVVRILLNYHLVYTLLENEGYPLKNGDYSIGITASNIPTL